MSSTPFVQPPQSQDPSDNRWNNSLDMAQASSVYRYAAPSSQSYYSPSSRTDYDDQQASYSRKFQDRPMTPQTAPSMDSQGQAYAFGSYPDANASSPFANTRIDVYAQQQQQYYQSAQIPRSARNIDRRDLMTTPVRYGERDGYGFDSYTMPHSGSSIPSVSYPASDARRRSSDDSAPAPGNGTTLPWDHLPSIQNQIPSGLPGQWAGSSQFDALDSSRRPYDAWQSRGPSSGANTDSAGSTFSSSRLPSSQTPSDYPLYASGAPASYPETTASSASNHSHSHSGLPETQPMSTVSSNHTSSSASGSSGGARVSPPPPRPYACEICGFAFARNHDLTRHIRGHEPAQFRCERCDKAYTRLDSLRRHYVRKRCGPNATS